MVLALIPGVCEYIIILLYDKGDLVNIIKFIVLKIDYPRLSRWIPHNLQAFKQLFLGSRQKKARGIQRMGGFNLPWLEETT
jgi:hypothetical protein